MRVRASEVSGRCLLLLVACGCDRIFDLRAAEPFDAAFFDAALATSCPPSGTVPVFSTTPHQVLFRPCNQYTTSDRADDTAVATCSDHVEQGSIDSELAVAPDLAAPDASTLQFTPTLSPEGDQVYVFRYVSTTNTVLRYRRLATDRWDGGTALAFSSSITGRPIELSTPTRGPVRRTILHDGSGFWHELVDDGSATLALVDTFDPVSVLGVYNASAAQLSPDGLRVVVYGTLPRSDGTVMQSVWYADRDSLGSRFRAAAALTDVPIVNDPFLSEDCERLYFSGIGSIWYVQQLAYKRRD
jgi:hypothetical protein